MADKPYRDLDTVTRVALALLVVLSLLELARLGGLLIQNNLLVSLRDHSFAGDYMQSARANDARLKALAPLSGLGVLAMLVVFLRWTYRAMSNVHALGANGVDSPGWAVGSFFIPFVNLVAPYTAMSQIWRASISAGDWEAENAPIVGIWWALWLIAGLGGWIVILLAGEHGIAGLILRTRGTMADTTLDIARNVAMMVMVARVRANQDAQSRVADNFGGAPVTPF